MGTGIRRLAYVLSSLSVVALLAASILGQLPAQLSGQTVDSGSIRATPLVERADVHAGATVRALLRVDIPESLHLQSNKPRDPSLIPTELTFSPSAGVTVPEVVFPATIEIDFPGYDEPLPVFEGETLIGVSFKVDKTQAPGPVTVSARFRYQACDDRVCFFPVTTNAAWDFTVVPAGQALSEPQHRDQFATIAFGSGEAPPTAALASSSPPPAAPVASEASASDVLAKFDEFDLRTPTAGAYMGSDEFLRFIGNAEAGIVEAGWFEGQGVVAILALVFVGGLALNLTPCVLPMIPINLAIIGAGSQGGRRGRGFLLGSAYGAAMALVYGLIGLVVILTAGTFGTINSSPWFNIGIAVLFVAMALAMFDVINIDFSRWSNRIHFKSESRGTMLLAFGMGAVAALLAGACVAPVVIQVVVFSTERYSGGTTAALALPFVLGLGMALPWPIAGAGIAALPKPGAWMVRVKQVMGVFILAMAAYYGYTAYQGISSRWVDPASVSASVARQLESGWHSSLSDGLKQAELEGKPVLVDFWATWCKNCLTMDSTTMADPAVVRALEGYVKIKIQSEDLNASPTRELMQRINAVGLPAYAILQPR